ncbi:MAG: hypothetical protein OEY22_00505 [Candidatus Bathyarchaeota archaeon]|nr:hypothetical protein [Candidatus Bathyarchaeota archaeon]
MKSSDITVIAVPTYGCRVASLYYAFAGRRQGIIKRHEESKKKLLDKIVALIVVGNISAGGDLAHHKIILDHNNCKHPLSAKLSQPAECGQDSIYGTLMEDEVVKDNRHIGRLNT